MEPREFVDLELKLLHQAFNLQQEIYPMVVIIKDDKRFQVPVNYTNEAHKSIVAQGIKDLVKKSDPDIVVYVAEAWTKIIRDKLDRLEVGISATDPDKHEIVLAQIEFKTGEKYGAEALIIKYEGKRLLKDWMIIDSSTSMGRFVDFFPIKRFN
jgi:hypothetical protein